MCCVVLCKAGIRTQNTNINWKKMLWLTVPWAYESCRQPEVPLQYLLWTPQHPAWPSDRVPQCGGWDQTQCPQTEHGSASYSDVLAQRHPLSDREGWCQSATAKAVKKYFKNDTKGQMFLNTLESVSKITWKKKHVQVLQQRTTSSKSQFILVIDIRFF